MSDHAHKFGPFVTARFTGEATRRCEVAGCKVVSLDDEPWVEVDREVHPDGTVVRLSRSVRCF